MIWNSEAESMPREKLEALQLERLRKVVDAVSRQVPFYKRSVGDAGISGASLRSLDDIAALPFTVKDDLRVNYPFGFFAVPQQDIVRIHASSGTTGHPTVVGYTRRDIATWAEVMARTLTAAGATADETVHNAYGYGLFTGGLGIHYGAELIGAAVVPMSGGNTKRQIRLMIDFGSTILACTPSYALHLAEAAGDMGFSAEEFKLKGGVFGAEPWSLRMRDQLEERLGILALDIYGLSEVIGPGVSFECPEKHGLHVNEDQFLVETIDPATGTRLGPGEKGELVFTTITKEAMPLVRYRCGDISALNFEPCACGRTTVRMDRVTGRSDDMLIIRGVNVFPSQIESVIMEVDGIEPHYQLIVDRVEQLDTLEVLVEGNDQVFAVGNEAIGGLQAKVQDEIRSVLGVRANVRLVPPKTIARSEGKAVRVIDNRQL